MNQSADSNARKDLPSKVRGWLLSEGYPLEFRAANIMRKNGFSVRQGEYVRSADSENAREIDVAASMTHSNREILLRVYQVTECKWSKDKPWVVFVSPQSRMAESACAAQTIGSDYGQAVMWAIAGDQLVREMKLFSSPPEPGFNGREAFSKNNDRFYNSMKSVTDLTMAIVKEYDGRPRESGSLPHACVVAFPVILIEGQLFEAYFCDEDNSMKIREAQQVRCHWRGSPSWSFHATIDLVTLGAFDEFCATRSEETMQLLNRLLRAHEQVKLCIEKSSLDPLDVQPGGRGIVGVPQLLMEVITKRKIGG
jgi:hypothetical protein